MMSRGIQFSPRKRFTFGIVKVKITVCMLASVLLVGCVGISRPTTQLLEIQSNPPGALAVLSTGRQCITPCNLVVPRTNDIDIKFSLPGYHDLTMTAKSLVDGVGVGAVAGNVVTGAGIYGTAAYVSFFALLGAAGSATASGVWVVAGAACVYLVYATARDVNKGKLRSIYPNPVAVQLKKK